MTKTKNTVESHELASLSAQHEAATPPPQIICKISTPQM